MMRYSFYTTINTLKRGDKYVLEGVISVEDLEQDTPPLIIQEVIESDNPITSADRDALDMKLDHYRTMLKENQGTSFETLTKILNGTSTPTNTLTETPILEVTVETTNAS